MMTESKTVRGMNLTGLGLVEKKVAVVVLFVLIVACFIGTLSGGEASIGGYGSESPTAFKVALTTDGAIAIFAPADTQGHWDTDGEYFSDQPEVFFCPMEEFGIQKYTFIPNDPDRCQSNVYAIVCRFAG